MCEYACVCVSLFVRHGMFVRVKIYKEGKYETLNMYIPIYKQTNS